MSSGVECELTELHHMKYLKPYHVELNRSQCKAHISLNDSLPTSKITKEGFEKGLLMRLYNTFIKEWVCLIRIRTVGLLLRLELAKALNLLINQLVHCKEDIH